ncbi:MAG: metal ABC transporter solute-binding protein, Zn/Mn family [Paracoccaceae bacterium]
MRVTRRLILAAAAAAFLPIQSFADEAKLNVVATTGMIADAAMRVGGDAVSVKALMGPGVDPHAYRQTRTDIVAMGQADLVLWNGLYLEAQMEDVLAQIAGRTSVVAVAEAVPTELRVAHDDYADRFDPHVWMDPKLWSTVVLAVRDAMIDVAPAQEAVFTQNTEAFLAEISALASYSDTVLSSVAEPARVLITAHDAFNYFGDAHGFEVIGIQGISTESEAGLNRMTELVDMLVERGIASVFVESSVSDRSVRALIEGAASRGHEVRIGGELFSDAMGAPGTYEGTYIGMIDHNVTTISSGLGGEAPARGMNGRLSAGS